MKYFYFTITFLLLTAQYSLSQNWDFTPYGFVKADIMHDSRQTVNVRDGHVLLYPVNKKVVDGGDINEGAVFNILAVQSRFGFRINAPDFLGAKSSGVLEGEYFGSTNADLGSVRLRHAFVKLDWGNHEVIAGHDWNPIFIAEAYARVISFSTGIPFVAFSRNPLVTYSFKKDNFKLMLSGISEMEFPSTGPLGPSTTYLRNSGMPMLNLGTRLDLNKVYLAANVSYKSLKPRLVSEKDVKENSVSEGITANFLARYKTDDFLITASALFGQNTYDLLMLGGYAEKSIDAVTDIRQYTPIDVGSAWFDTEYGNDLKVGLFGAYSYNYGAEDEVVGNYYSRGSDIEYLYRIAPRIVYRIGKTQIAAEIEYTVAAYGDTDNRGVVKNSEEVANLRILLAAYIFF